MINISELENCAVNFTMETCANSSKIKVMKEFCDWCEKNQNSVDSIVPTNEAWISVSNFLLKGMVLSSQALILVALLVGSLTMLRIIL